MKLSSAQKKVADLVRGKQVYSPSTEGIYPGSLYMTYLKAGSWPDDFVVVSSEDHHTYFQNAPPREHTRQYSLAKGFYWKEIKADIKAGLRMSILEMEASITPRRLREAVLTIDGKVWLEDIEEAIQSKRKLL